LALTSPAGCGRSLGIVRLRTKTTEFSFFLVLEVKIKIFSIYRAPLGNIDYFINKLDHVLNSFLKDNLEFIICGGVNINYLEPSIKKTKLDDMLNIYNLMGTVYFPTRNVKNSATLIDNIFIENRNRFTIKPCINVLSDHNAQLTIFNNLHIPDRTPENIHTRNINKTTIMEFESLLSWEVWDDILGNNVNIMFNNFHKKYFRCFMIALLKNKLVIILIIIIGLIKG
jgi:hypothetical protein